MSNYLAVLQFLEKYQQNFVCLFIELMGGGRRARLVRPFEKNLNLTIIGQTKTLKIQGYDHELQDFWSDQGRSGRPAPPALELGLKINKLGATNRK